MRCSWAKVKVQEEGVVSVSRSGERVRVREGLWEKLESAEAVDERDEGGSDVEER